MRHFSEIPKDTQSARRSPRFSTAQGMLPRYTPVGIRRVGVRAIWVVSEWGIKSQTIVLFDVSADGVRKLSSALISGC